MEFYIVQWTNLVRLHGAGRISLVGYPCFRRDTGIYPVVCLCTKKWGDMSMMEVTRWIQLT